MPIDYESAKTYVFSVLDSAGSPILGLSGTWTSLSGVESGLPVTPASAAIVELSSGLYQTTIDWVSVVAADALIDGEAVVGVIDWGATVSGPERYTYASFNTRDYAPHKDTNVLSSVSADVEVVKEIQTGRWEISGNQLVLYKSDNTTVIATFNLFDKNGSPTGDAPYSRVRS